MKKLLFLFALCAGTLAAQNVVPCFPSGTGGVWTYCTLSPIPTYAQSVVGNKSSGNVASLGIVFGSNNTAGNSVIVVAAVGNGTQPTISDTNSNVYALATGSNICISTTFCLYQFVAVNIKAGANTVTINNGGSTTSIAGAIYEVTGLVTTTAIAGGTTQASANAYGNVSTGTATSTAPATGAIAVGTSNHFVIAGFAVGTAAQTITVASPYTNDSGQQNTTTPSGLYSFASASNFVSGTSTSASATITSEPWVADIVAYHTASVPIVGSVSILGSGTVLSGQQAVTGSAVALATNTAKNICVKALDANTINVYVGPSGITTSTGMELGAGQAVCLPVSNTNLLYVIASTTGASVSWVATN